MTGSASTPSRRPGGWGPNLPTYDERSWPIFVVTMPANVTPHEAMVGHLNYIDSLFERGQPFAIIFDSRDFPTPNPAERKLIARHMAKTAGLYPGRLRGMAMVLSSAMALGGFLALKWLARPAYPTPILSTVNEAMDWLKHHVSFDPDSTV